METLRHRMRNRRRSGIDSAESISPSLPAKKDGNAHKAGQRIRSIIDRDLLVRQLEAKIECMIAVRQELLTSKHPGATQSPPSV